MRCISSGNWSRRARLQASQQGIAATPVAGEHDDTFNNHEREIVVEAVISGISCRSSVRIPLLASSVTKILRYCQSSCAYGDPIDRDGPRFFFNIHVAVSADRYGRPVAVVRFLSVCSAQMTVANLENNPALCA